MVTQYHRDVFLPKTLEMEVLSTLVKLDGRFRLTRHAAERAQGKGITLPKKLPFQKCRVIEVSTMEGRLYKFLIRFTHDEKNDAVVSMNPNGTVITIWKNEKCDQHKTLNADAYTQG